MDPLKNFNNSPIETRSVWQKPCCQWSLCISFTGAAVGASWAIVREIPRMEDLSKPAQNFVQQLTLLFLLTH